jgi:hypothetical protein
VEENKGLQGLQIVSTLWSCLPEGEGAKLADYAESVSIITGEDTATCVLRALATRAMRMGVPLKAVVSKIIEEGSVDLILPALF